MYKSIVWNVHSTCAHHMRTHTYTHTHIHTQCASQWPYQALCFQGNQWSVWQDALGPGGNQEDRWVNPCWSCTTPVKVGAFIQEELPDSHRFMQDNDSKHTSRRAAGFLSDEGVNWWKTPPESADLNPIENLWHKLKEYCRREVKPTNKSELIWGIKLFWDTVDVQQCCRYIDHLRKVIPQVIQVDGAATGY